MDVNTKKIRKSMHNLFLSIRRKRSTCNRALLSFICHHTFRTLCWRKRNKNKVNDYATKNASKETICEKAT
jgi:hypothetical protein